MRESTVTNMSTQQIIEITIPALLKYSRSCYVNYSHNTFSWLFLGYGSLTSYLHGQHEVSPQSLSSSYGARDLSMRSPSFSSPPSQSSSGPGSVPSYGGQLSTMSPANMYSSASPGIKHEIFI